MYFIIDLFLQNTDGIVDGLKENDLVEIIEKSCPNFKSEGLTIDQLQVLLLGGPSQFEIMRPVRNNDSDNQGRF